MQNSFHYFSQKKGRASALEAAAATRRTPKQLKEKKEKIFYDT